MSDQDKRVTVKLASQRDLNAIGVLMSILILTIAWLFVVIYRQSEVIDKITASLQSDRKKFDEFQFNMNKIHGSVVVAGSKVTLGFAELNRDLILEDNGYSLRSISEDLDKLKIDVGMIWDNVIAMRMPIEYIHEDVFYLRNR